MKRPEVASSSKTLLPFPGEGGLQAGMNPVRREEDSIRILMHRVITAQEAQSRHLSLELHDHITQLLCATILRCQKLTHRLPEDSVAYAEAMELGGMLTKAAEEVERISRHLRPSVLDNLGLSAALRASTTEFGRRTGVVPKVVLSPLTTSLPPEAELALFRILQEALKNIEEHAGTCRVSVQLLQQGAVAQLTIQDDGNGFDASHPVSPQEGTVGLGLLGMRERATCVGGTLQVESAPGKGTIIRALIPFATVGNPASHVFDYRPAC